MLNISKYMVVFLTLLCMGCSSASYAVRQEKYKQACNTWLNHDINDLVRQWGPPKGVSNMPNGNKVYTWSSSTTTQDPATTSPSTPTYSDDVRTAYQNKLMTMSVEEDANTNYCNTSFGVNPSGAILDCRFEGDSCVSD
jgi:hypothetical protein